MKHLCTSFICYSVCGIGNWKLQLMSFSTPYFTLGWALLLADHMKHPQIWQLDYVEQKTSNDKQPQYNLISVETTKGETKGGGVFYCIVEIQMKLNCDLFERGMKDDYTDKSGSLGLWGVTWGVLVASVVDWLSALRRWGQFAHVTDRGIAWTDPKHGWSQKLRSFSLGLAGHQISVLLFEARAVLISSVWGRHPAVDMLDGISSGGIND